MEFGFIVTIFLIGFVGSYISGMLGIGGSIIKYPMLLYIRRYSALQHFLPMRLLESVRFKSFLRRLVASGLTEKAVI